ncbi:hypothetical protein ACFWA6_00075 [Streptomyces sp. NPDC060020]|uniref:hypothetical protein n=1 Tax=Streptomyces sp. NPDC060020 TaxID=3347038 RepID=UPI00368564AD
MPTPARHASPYGSWIRYFSPTANHRGLGLVCLGVGVPQGVLLVAAPALLWLVPGVLEVAPRRRYTGCWWPCATPVPRPPGTGMP